MQAASSLPCCSVVALHSGQLGNQAAEQRRLPAFHPKSVFADPRRVTSVRRSGGSFSCGTPRSRARRASSGPRSGEFKVALASKVRTRAHARRAGLSQLRMVLLATFRAQSVAGTVRCALRAHTSNFHVICLTHASGRVARCRARSRLPRTVRINWARAFRRARHARASPAQPRALMMRTAARAILHSQCCAFMCNGLL